MNPVLYVNLNFNLKFKLHYLVVTERNKSISSNQCFILSVFKRSLDSM